MDNVTEIQKLHEQVQQAKIAMSRLIDCKHHKILETIADPFFMQNLEYEIAYCEYGEELAGLWINKSVNDMAKFAKAHGMDDALIFKAAFVCETSVSFSQYICKEL